MRYLLHSLCPHSPDASAASAAISLLLRELLLQLACLIDRLARSEVLQLEQLAKLDLAFLAFAVGSGGALGPLDRLFLRLDLDQPVTRDQLLRLREGPVDHRALPSGEL